MRSGVYLVEAEIVGLKINNLPPGDILFTLRIGRNSCSLNLSSGPSQLIAGVLQLNVDASALQAQRCSITINRNTPQDKKMLGIALVSLPKDKNNISNTYKLTQSEDKQAEIDLKIKISPIDSSGLKNTGSLQLASDQMKLDIQKQNPVSNITSNIKVKSKQSDERSGSDEQKRLPKNYKVMEEDKVLQVSEKELKRYKDQKEAYYQMYQIEKSKNQVATKFISTFIKKISQKYPSMVQAVHENTGPSLLVPDGKRKGGIQVSKLRHNTESAMAQLEQANRSLHRQVQEYKHIVDQLRKELSNALNKNGDTKKNTDNLPTPFDLVLNTKTPRERKNSIIPASLKASLESQRIFKQTFADLNLRQWLEKSIDQREEFQANFSKKIQIHSPDKVQNKAAITRKLKLGIDKAFNNLLSHKQFTRPVLLSHKQEVNRILDDYIAA